MAVTDRFRQQHADIMAVAGSIEGCLGSAAQAAAARTALNSLAGKLSIHLAMEDTSLYPRLGSHPEIELRNMAQSFAAEMAGIKQVFLDYNKKWSERAIADDFQAFATQTKAVLEALKNRNKRENTQLYALYDRTAG